MDFWEIREGLPKGREAGRMETTRERWARERTLNEAGYAWKT